MGRKRQLLLQGMALTHGASLDDVICIRKSVNLWWNWTHGGWPNPFVVFLQPLFELNMGRPAGTMERKFSVEEVQSVALRCQIPAARLDVLMSDARALFGNAAGEKVTITRRMVCESLWLMRELVQESPVQIVHVDSILSLSLISVAYVFWKVHVQLRLILIAWIFAFTVLVCDSHVPRIGAVLSKIFQGFTHNIDPAVVTVLAWDAKALMQNLKQHQWVHVWHFKTGLNIWVSGSTLILSISGTCGKQDERGSTWQGKKSCQRVSGQHVHNEPQTCSRSLSWCMMLMQMAKLMILMRQGSFNPSQTLSYQVVVWCHTSCAGGEDCIGLGCRSWRCLWRSARPHGEDQGETCPKLHCRC